MSARFPLVVLIVVALFVFAACKKQFSGTPKENLAPETHTAVDTIIRVGPDRLESQVELRWWGDDPDGVVTGYEFTFDSVVTPATVWRFTSRNDSTFLLPIPPGFDSVDFRFHVRAVDNNGLVDPTPAALGVPVKNSQPSIVFLDGPNKPLKTFPVLKFYWNATDPDGEENIKQYEVVWNDTMQAPFVLDATALSATFEAVNPQATGATDVNVYPNNSATSIGTMQGLLLSDSNVLFIRVVDNSLARSAYAASYKVFVKRVTSEVLLVDGYGNAGATVTNFYAQNLQAIGIAAFDTMQVFQTIGAAFTQQAPDALTQARIFKMFSTIVWYSNDANRSLSLGQKTLGSFFDAGGKLLMATYVAGSFDPQSTFLTFTPAQALVTLPPDTVLTLNTGAAVTNLQADYPPLQSTAIVSTVRPVTPALGATALYNVELLAKNTSNGGTNPWTGPSTVMVKKDNGSGQTNFVLSTLELQKLNGLGNMEALFDQIFHDEFGL